MMKIFIYQPGGSTDYHKNLDILLTKIKTVQEDLLIFPELYLTGYLIRDELFKYRFPNQDFDLIQKMAEKYEKYVIFGFPEYDGVYYNAAALIDRDGQLNIIRKNYTPNFGPFEEKLYFKESDTVRVFNTEFGKIGVHICYDIFFPEISKTQAMRGAKMLINISASPITSRAYFEALMVARAIENTVFYVYNNWAGTQRSMVFWGGSSIISPRGQVLARAPYMVSATLRYELDFDDIRVAKMFRPTIRDTRLKVIEQLMH